MARNSAGPIIVGIPNACQARDWALPQMEIAGFTSRGGTSGGTQPLGNNGFSSSVLDYNDGQYQVVANLGWTRGSHNVKFGGDFHWQSMNHYEISPLTSMRFTGIATSLNGGPAANSYNALADFLLGQIGDNMSNAQVPPCVVADQLRTRTARDDAGARNGILRARPVADWAETDRLLWIAVGILPGAGAGRPRGGAFRPRRPTAC